MSSFLKPKGWQLKRAAYWRRHPARHKTWQFKRWACSRSGKAVCDWVEFTAAGKAWCLAQGGAK